MTKKKREKQGLYPPVRGSSQERRGKREEKKRNGRRGRGLCDRGIRETGEGARTGTGVEGDEGEKGS